MSSRGNVSEGELVRLLAAGDENAFTEIYRRCQAPVYRFALHMSGSPAVAEDTTQDVFLILMDKASEYDAARGRLMTYLYGIARKLLLRHFEQRARLRTLDRDSEPAALPEPLIDRLDPLDTLGRIERLRALRAAILTLPIRYREAVVFCDLQEMGYEQAAQAVGCAVGTIRSRLHRGRALLASKLRAPDRRTAASLKTKGCLA
jgi:RNA polymerase sigma-70 factor (ECF subfamily)